MALGNGWTCSALLADLQTRGGRINAILLQPGIHPPEDVLAEALQLTRVAFQAAGLDGEEETRMALYRDLVEYLDAPARPRLQLVSEIG